MRIDEFNYELPQELIAQQPLEPRDESRMLVVSRQKDEFVHKRFADLPDVLECGDLIVLNDARVTAMRLFGKKTTGAAVEALLLRESEPLVFDALVRPAKRLSVGARLVFEGDLEAEVVDITETGGRLLRFLGGDVGDRLCKIAKTPLPPYIHGDIQDPERYQTVYSISPGSSAAPTAGLHFTRRVFEQLSAKGVLTAFITLDVGVDTFRPVSEENVEEHRIHGERYCIPAETARAVSECKGRVIAVGTTAVRAVETAAIGARTIRQGAGCSQLFITPGYEFRVVDGMLTNFHMPKTTMLLMVAALIGKDRLVRAYEQAILSEYRFLSFGDCMLIIGEKQ